MDVSYGHGSVSEVQVVGCQHITTAMDRTVNLPYYLTTSLRDLILAISRCLLIDSDTHTIFHPGISIVLTEIGKFAKKLWNNA